MKVCLLGTGTPAPDPARQSAALAVTIGHERLLFDAGRAVVTQLARAGLAPESLSTVFLTHHNYDHICGLGDLLLSAWHAGVPALTLAGPHGSDEIFAALFERVYRAELVFTGRLLAALGQPFRPIEQVVGVRIIAHGGQLRGRNWRVTAAAVDHGRALGLGYDEWPCLAYAVEAEGKRLVVSGDTILCDEIVELARGADLLVQCCQRAEVAITGSAQRLIDEQVIASAGQAGQIAARAGVKRLALTHLSPMAPDLLATIAADVGRSYAGPLILGEDLLEIAV
jgi:ribonuclease Z